MPVQDENTDWDAAAEVEDIPEGKPVTFTELPSDGDDTSDISSERPEQDPAGIMPGGTDIDERLLILLGGEGGVERERLIDNKTGVVIEEHREPIPRVQHIDGQDVPVKFQEASELAEEPSAVEIAAAEALLARVGRGPLVPDAPVSSSSAPIKLEENDPTMRVLHLDGMDVISTADRIQVVRQHLDPEMLNKQPPAEPPPQSARVRDNILAEQSAGRAALNRHEQRAELFPRPKPTAKEIAAEGHSTPVFTPSSLSHLIQDRMLKTPVPGKGEGY